MILKRRVALNGVWLDEVDSRIAVSSVEPGDGRENISAVDAAAGYGSRITGERRQTVDMTVKFRIHEKGRSEAGMQARSVSPSSSMFLVQKAKMTMRLAKPAMSRMVPPGDCISTASTKGMAQDVAPR